MQQEIYARPWEPIDLHVDDVTVLLALHEKTVGRNGISYMMKRLGTVCPLDSIPGSSLQRVHCTTATNY